MNKTSFAKATTTINASTSRVWHALTDAAMIKQYLFGSDVITNWRVGSPIIYKGTWQGKPFEDKGKVLQVEPEKRLVVTHWSPLSNVPDTPENYHKVTYEIAAEDGGTRVTITQDNNASREEAEHSEQNWKTVLENMKKLLEDQ